MRYTLHLKQIVASFSLISSSFCAKLLPLPISRAKFIVLLVRWSWKCFSLCCFVRMQTSLNRLLITRKTTIGHRYALAFNFNLLKWVLAVSCLVHRQFKQELYTARKTFILSTIVHRSKTIPNKGQIVKFYYLFSRSFW